MEVEVTGLPEPTVTWLKDDKPIKEAGLSEHRLLAQGNSYKLIIERGKKAPILNALKCIQAVSLYSTNDRLGQVHGEGNQCRRRGQEHC